MSSVKKENIEVCSTFCVFYKPGEKECEVCRGLEAYDRIKQRLVETIPPVKVFPIPSALDAVLDAKVCSTCEWRENDCDYRSKTPPVDSRPCGGIMILAALIWAGTINEEDF